MNRLVTLDRDEPVLPATLSDDARAAMRAGLAELLFFLAGDAEPDRGLAHNERASRWYGPAGPPRPFLVQRGNSYELWATTLSCR